VPCYRVSHYLSDDEIEAVMAWLQENRQALGLIRGQAVGAAGRQGSSKQLWLAKFVFREEEGARMFCRRWLADYRDDMPVAPWR
jgi:hypothetical protein